jgi:hypothetical protein
MKEKSYQKSIWEDKYMSITKKCLKAMFILSSTVCALFVTVFTAAGVNATIDYPSTNNIVLTIVTCASLPAVWIYHIRYCMRVIREAKAGREQQRMVESTENFCKWIKKEENLTKAGA